MFETLVTISFISVTHVEFASTKNIHPMHRSTNNIQPPWAWELTREDDTCHGHQGYIRSKKNNGQTLAKLRQMENNGTPAASQTVIKKDSLSFAEFSPNTTQRNKGLLTSSDSSHMNTGFATYYLSETNQNDGLAASVCYSNNWNKNESSVTSSNKHEEKRGHFCSESRVINRLSTVSLSKKGEIKTSIASSPKNKEMKSPLNSFSANDKKNMEALNITNSVTQERNVSLANCSFTVAKRDISNGDRWLRTTSNTSTQVQGIAAHSASIHYHVQAGVMYTTPLQLQQQSSFPDGGGDGRGLNSGGQVS